MSIGHDAGSRRAGATGEQGAPAGHGSAQVAERLAEVRARIASAGGDPDRIVVVAVTKGFGTDAVAAATRAGLWDVGENYAQELFAKAAAAPAGVRWHFLGPVQRNKVPQPGPACLPLAGARSVGRGRGRRRRRPAARVLVQVNVSGEPRKARLPAGGHRGTGGVVAPARSRRAGLMAVGPAGRPRALGTPFDGWPGSAGSSGSGSSRWA